MSKDTKARTSPSNIADKRADNQQNRSMKTQSGQNTTHQVRGTSSTKRANLKRAAYPWTLAAICILLLYNLLTDNWGFKLDIQFYFGAYATIIFIATCLFKENRRLLASRISKITIIIAAQCVLYFISLFYATYPKLALQEFYLNIGAFFLFLSAYVAFLRSENNIRIFAWLFSLAITIASIFSIELATSGYLMGFIKAIGSVLNAEIPSGYAAFETNTRIVTVLGNANVFAPIVVFGMFMALWRFGSSNELTRTSFVDLSFAMVCGTAFVLCFSLGTILSYIVMLLVFVVLTKKEQRGGQLATHLFCLIMSILTASLAFTLRDKGPASILVVLILSGGAAFAWTRVKPIKLPTMSGLAKKATVAGLVFVCVAFAVCAMLIQGAYELNAAGTFRRAIAVNPGTHSVSAAFDGAVPDSTVTMSIESMSYTQAALKEKTALTSAVLKSGESVDFNVPDSSAVVFITVTANNELSINDVTIKGETGDQHLALKYRLLPEFIVNRLQGIWANDNAIQRFIFFRDGIRLGLRAPIFGLGGGSFSGGLYSAADYFYQSRHTHNEYIERFVDGGIVGTTLFVAFAVFIIRAILKARRSETEKTSKLLPFLGAVMAMVFVHALIEVDFMFGAYRCASALLFALVAAVCEDDVKPVRWIKAATLSVISVLAVCTALLTIGQNSAVKSINSHATIATLQTAMETDPINKDDYVLSYLMATRELVDPYIVETQEKYLNAMEGDINGYDTRAQFLLTKTNPDYDRGIAAAEAYVRENRVNIEAWDKVFALYNAILDMHIGDTNVVSKINGSIRTLCDYLSQLDATLPKKIEPELAEAAYLRMVRMEAGDWYSIIDSRDFCDIDKDGKSDIVDSHVDDAIAWRLKAPLLEVYAIKVYQQASASCEVAINGVVYQCEYQPDEGCFVAYTTASSQPVSELSIKTNMYSDKVYFTVNRTQ